MIRQSTEFSAAALKGKPSNGLADESAVFDEEMELDEQMREGEGWGGDGMDTEEPTAAAKGEGLLKEAVKYGQQLHNDYPTNERGGDKKMLDDIFSLVAYPDPKQSVHGHYLDPAGRSVVAEELNSAILGEPSSMQYVFLCLLTD